VPPFWGQAVSEGYGAPVQCSSTQTVTKPKKRTMQEEKSSTVLQAGTGTAAGQQNFSNILGQKPQRLVENAKPTPAPSRGRCGEDLLRVSRVEVVVVVVVVAVVAVVAVVVVVGGNDGQAGGFPSPDTRRVGP